jgi:hypothetical protein
MPVTSLRPPPVAIQLMSVQLAGVLVELLARLDRV